MSAIAFRPPAPRPRTKPLGLLARIAALRRNPIEIWTKAHYDVPVMVSKTVFGNRVVVSYPAGVRRIFLDNVVNYRKDDLQLRVLRPGLGNSLLTADGEEWRTQRHSLAPLFTPRRVTEFADAMSEATREGVERLRQSDGRRIDLSDEMARLTLEILEHTLFSSGLSRDPGEFQRAVTRYFDTIGRVDLMDLLGLPQFLPSFGRRRGRATLEWFGKTVEDIVGTRRKLIAEGRAAPRDILTLVLEAQDPDTGRGMPEDDLRANIVTFIGCPYRKLNLAGN